MPSGALAASLAIASLLPAAAAPPPEPLHAVVQETNGDLFLDTLLVYFRPVTGQGVARYRLSWSTSESMEGAVTRTVNQNETAAWIETTTAISPRGLYDYQRVHVGVESLDASGEAGPMARTSAFLDERPSPRGDANEDGSVDVGDALAVLFHLFGGRPALSTQGRSYSGDANGDGLLELSDAVHLLSWLFGDGPAPEEGPLPARRTLLLGIFYVPFGQFPMLVNMGHIRALESWQGKKNAVLNIFVSWTAEQTNNLFATQLPNIWNNGSVPMITWMPEPSGAGTTPTVEKLAADGRYDAFFENWAGRMRTWLAGPDGKLGTAGSPEIRDDRRLYVRLGHEMNGWWSDWNATTGNNRPEDFVTMWRRIHGIVAGHGIGPHHLQWVWCVNHVDADFEDGSVQFPAERYYPGPEYVDWISLDGYNWGYSMPWTNAWLSPVDVFSGDWPQNRMLSRLRNLTINAPKPICVAEYGCSSIVAKNPVTSNVATKSSWITSNFSYLLSSGVKMAVYFDLDKETDWAIFGGGSGDFTFSFSGSSYRCYNAYRDAIRSRRIIGAGNDPLRRLTDDEFMGR